MLMSVLVVYCNHLNSVSVCCSLMCMFANCHVFIKCNAGRNTLCWILPRLLCYTLNKSFKWYIVYICRVFRKGLIVYEFYPYFDLECVINTNNFVYADLKSSCQFQSTKKWWHLKQNCVLSQNKQDTENIVYLSNFLRGYFQMTSKMC